MITQVLELVLLSHLYHSCALKSVRKAFFFPFFGCLSTWLTKHRQRFPNEVLLSTEDLILPLWNQRHCHWLQWKSDHSSSPWESKGLPKEDEHPCITAEQLAEVRNTTKPFSPWRRAVSSHTLLYCKWERLLKDLCLCVLCIFFPVAYRCSIQPYHECFRNSIAINAFLPGCDLWCIVGFLPRQKYKT